ncbi:MAG: sigma 54-interacting transcriptional regulator, partial [Acidobacteria bacterium]|nr:sigma 54-interacting transcriptional regulator [Acidobacteriota bacterium]
AIALHNALHYGELSESHVKLSYQKNYMEAEFLRERGFERIIGNSPAIVQVLKQISAVAPTDSTVLITGETGTGKELVARTIHERSPRRDHSFVKVDCSAIPAGLMESELFGHEKGAFTGATAQKLGRFEIADQGTVFLDEIGDVPPELQPKLLRVLQDHSFERLGSTRTRNVDVRIIAATHRDLEAMAEEGKFREDLYYRLKVFPIVIPPLRDRASDIPALVQHCVEFFARRMQKPIPGVPPSTMEAFVRYPWPGNVRELQHFIERSVVLTAGRQLQAPLAELRRFTRASPRRTAGRTLAEIQREAILQALEESNWVVGGPHGAAARLGIKRTTLASRMESFGITRPRGSNRNRRAG